MRFSSDSQRKAVFANMGGSMSSSNQVKFSQRGAVFSEDEDALGISGAISSGTCSSCGGPARGFKSAIERKEYGMSGLCSACQDKVFGGNEMELDEEYASKQAADGEEKVEDRITGREEFELIRKSVKDNSPKNVKESDNTDFSDEPDDDNSFGEPIYTYTKEDAVEDGQQKVIGVVGEDKVYITDSLVGEFDTEDKEKALLDKAVAELKKPNDEDTPSMKLRAFGDGKLWVIKAADGITIMRPSDY